MQVRPRNPRFGAAVTIPIFALVSVTGGFRLSSALARAQGTGAGMVSDIVGTIGFATGVVPLALGMTAAALVAAFLNPTSTDAALVARRGGETHVIISRLHPGRMQ